MLTVSASMLSTYKVCPRLYYFRYIENLVPVSMDEKLVAGSGMHIGIAAYYKNNMDRNIAFDYLTAWKNQLWEKYHALPLVAQTDEQADEISDAVDMSYKLLEYYLDFAQVNDAFKVNAIEQDFEVPVWTPDNKVMRGVRFKGTFDGIVTDHNNNVWLLEHKSAASFPQDIVLQLDHQANYYYLAATQLLGKPRGILYNVVRKIKRPNQVKDDIVKRISVIRNEDELLAIKNDLYYTVQNLKKDMPIMQHKFCAGLHCTWRCSYTSLCTAMNAGMDWRYIAEAKYVVEPERESWEDKINAVAKRITEQRVLKEINEGGKSYE